MRESDVTPDFPMMQCMKEKMATNLELQSSGSEYSDFSIASYEIDDDSPPEFPYEHLENLGTSSTGVFRGYMFEPEAEESEENVNIP